MKFIIVLFLILTPSLYSQPDLIFDKQNIDCEDKWVTTNMNEDSSYTYGYIYLDEDAGLSLNIEGSFKINSDNTYQVKKNELTNIKIRLEPNNVKLAIIPSTLFNDLQIDSIPEWLKIFKKDTNSVERLYKRGFAYNGWGRCDKALEILLEAKSIDPDYEGLAVELAYSYNCLDDFDKAAEVLSVAIESDPENAYVIKEYIYTLVRKKDIDKASEVYYNSVELEIDSVYNAANCFNIIGYYFYQKDANNFEIWLKELKKWPNDNKQIDRNIKLMIEEFKNS